MRTWTATGNGSGGWVSATHVEDLELTPDVQVWSAIADSGGMSQQVRVLSALLLNSWLLALA